MVWWIKSSIISQKRGTTLIEVIVTMVIVSIIVLSLLNLTSTTSHIVTDNKLRTVALGIANEKMEIIRNLPYSTIGTINGVPSGSLNQTETDTLNAVPFTVKTAVKYIDDPYDKLAPQDTLPTDYKQATVTVSWTSPVSSTPVSLSTNISPNGIETTANDGTLWFEVFDPSTTPSTPIKSATITITAATTTPTVSITGKTDSNGQYILPGAPVGVQAYHIVVTKPGYSSDQTFALNPITNPNPNPGDLNVLAGQVTTQYFEISPLATSLTIKTQNVSTTTPLSTSIKIQGAKTIGTDGSGAPIYKYTNTIQTDASGAYQFTNLDSDTYALTLDPAANPQYVIAGYTPALPFTALPQSTSTATLYLTTYQPNTALITVTDANGAVLPAASVRLYKTDLSYDQTITDTSYGQAFFNNLAPGVYNVTVSLTGYTTSNTTLTINGNNNATVTLATGS